MRIACLQFSPKLGDITGNIARADRILEEAEAEKKGIDLLVLPELAFSGYNFPDLEAIRPFLEPTAAGITAEWAQRTAQRLGCWVVAGYPEIYVDRNNPAQVTARSKNIIPGNLQDDCLSPGTSISSPTPSDPSVIAYNSALLISPSSSHNLAGHYRKSHLYYTDYTWAHPNPAEKPFYFSSHPIASSRAPNDSWKGTAPVAGDLRVAMGICMDMNPYKFEAPYTDYEFGTHCRDCEVDLVILPTAWLTQEVDRVFPGGMGMVDNGEESIIEKIVDAISPNEEEKEMVRMEITLDMMRERAKPDWDTIEYWAKRLKPVWDGSGPAGKAEYEADGGDDGMKAEEIQELVGKQDGKSKKKTVFVTCNRVGTEGDAVYVGSSTVLELEEGRIKVKGALGKGVEKLLVVDVDVGGERDNAKSM